MQVSSTTFPQHGTNPCIKALRTLNELGPFNRPIDGIHSTLDNVKVETVLAIVLSPDPTGRIVILGGLTVLTLMTMISNLLVCIIAATDRHLRNRSNVFFVSLAITNLFYALTVMSLSIVLNCVTDPYFFNSSVLTIFHALDTMFCTASILHLVAIAFDRFIKIVHPLAYARIFRLRVHTTLIICFWFFSALLAYLPVRLSCQKERPSPCDQQTDISPVTASPDRIPCISTESHSHVKHSVTATATTTTSNVCYHRSNLSCALTNAILSFLFPLLIMVIIYSRLFVITRRHLKQIQSHKRAMTQLCSNTSLKSGVVEPMVHLSTASLQRVCSSSMSLGKIFYLPVMEEEQMMKTLSSFEKESNNLTVPYNSHACRSLPSRSQSTTYATGLVAHSAPVVGNMSNNRKTRLIRRNTLCAPGRHTSRRPSEVKPVYGSTGLLQRRPTIGRLNASFHSEYKASVTLGLIMGSFLVCWLPFFLLNCISALFDGIRKELFFAVTWLGYSNACINPIIYTVLNSQFRRAAIRLLCTCQSRPCGGKKDHFGLSQLRSAGNTTIRLALGTLPPGKDAFPPSRVVTSQTLV